MKVIKVESCRKCPYIIEEIGIITIRHNCGHPDNREHFLVLSDIDIIAEICPLDDTRKKENSCHDCADGEAPRRSKPWTCARVARKEVACNMADQWRPK